MHEAADPSRLRAPGLSWVPPEALQPPAATGPEVALLTFAQTLGERLGMLPSEAARVQAALVQSATQQVPSEFQRGVYEGLRLMLRGHALRLERDSERATLTDEDGSAIRRVLAVLARAGAPQRPTQLARELQLTPAYMNRLLKTMTNDELLVRSTAVIPTDKRAVTYTLSAAGEDLLFAARRHEVASSDAPSADEARRARARSARTMLEAVQERRRRGHVRDLDAAILERVYQSALADGDNVLVVDALGEKVTASRQRMTATPAVLSAARESELAPEAISLLERESTTDAYARARLEYERGKRTLEVARQPDDAGEHFAESANLLTPWPNAPIRAWNKLALSECMRLTGRFYEAIDYAEDAYKFAVHREDSFATVKAGIQLGLAYRTFGMVEPCQSLLTSVWELADAHGYPHVAAEARLHLGEATRYKGDVDAAVHLLESASEELRERGHGRGLAYAVSALGACYFDEGDTNRKTLTRSRDELYRALEVCDRASAQDARALTMRRLGHVLVTLGDTKRGGELLKGALSAYQSERTMSLVGQLECHTNMLEADGSKAQMRRAVVVLEQVKNQVGKQVETVADRHPTGASNKVRLVDWWVFDSLRAEARLLQDSESADAITKCWNELNDLGLAGSTRIHKGRSKMGKEPLRALRPV